MTDKIRIFVDINGTLARFHDEQMYLKRMFEKGFFSELKPFQNAIDAIKCIIDNPNVDVYVLSAAITTPYCIPEKNRVKAGEVNAVYCAGGYYGSKADGLTHLPESL